MRPDELVTVWASEDREFRIEMIDADVTDIRIPASMVDRTRTDELCERLVEGLQCVISQHIEDLLAVHSTPDRVADEVGQYAREAVAEARSVFPSPQEPSVTDDDFGAVKEVRGVQIVWRDGMPVGMRISQDLVNDARAVDVGAAVAFAVNRGSQLEDEQMTEALGRIDADTVRLDLEDVVGRIAESEMRSLRW